MSHPTVVVGNPRSRSLVDGVASTLRRFERDAAGASPEVDAAARRLQTFQRALARALQAAHLETLEEMGVDDTGRTVRFG